MQANRRDAARGANCKTAEGGESGGEEEKERELKAASKTPEAVQGMRNAVRRKQYNLTAGKCNTCERERERGKANKPSGMTSVAGGAMGGGEPAKA